MFRAIFLVIFIINLRDLNFAGGGGGALCAAGGIGKEMFQHTSKRKRLLRA